MIFSPSDPFPLAPEGATYAQEKSHSELVDGWLGIDIEKVESRLVDPRDGAKRWISQGPATFLTPYSELRRMLSQVAPPSNSLVVDLGAGYGRMGFVLHAHFPGVHFLGLELVEERAQEGARALAAFGCDRASLRASDISSEGFLLPEADTYFIYDFGSRPQVGKVLGQLRERSRQGSFVLIGRGREVRDQVEREHPWLTVQAPSHHGNFSLYRS